jgi:RNase P subunit RPR2
MSATTASPVQRWDDFLGKIEERYNALIAEAIAGSRDLFNDTEFNLVPVSQAWSAIRAQVLSLQRKIDDTWSSQVEAAFENAGIDYTVADKHRNKGFALSEKIETDYDRRYVLAMGDLAKTMFEKASVEATKTFPCKNCGTHLEPPKHVFRSAYIVCPSCNMSNTYEPGGLLRSAEHFCSDALSTVSAMAERDAMVRLEKSVNRLSSDAITLQHLKAWETATMTFWKKYLTARIALIPEFEKEYDADLNAAMKRFYDDVSRYPQWQSA